MAIIEREYELAGQRMQALREHGHAIAARYDRRRARGGEPQYRRGSGVSAEPGGRPRRCRAERPCQDRNLAQRARLALAEARRRSLRAGIARRSVREQTLVGSATRSRRRERAICREDAQCTRQRTPRRATAQAFLTRLGMHGAARRQAQSLARTLGGKADVPGMHHDVSSRRRVSSAAECANPSRKPYSVSKAY